MNIDWNDKENVQDWIRNGNNINACINGGGFFERPPLGWAALSGSHKVVSLLVESKADINIEFPFRTTPLQCAYNECHYSLVLDLIEFGADLPNFSSKISLFGNGITFENIEPALIEERLSRLSVVQSCQVFEGNIPDIIIEFMTSEINLVLLLNHVTEIRKQIS